jgi:hypothetical protein
MSLRLVKWCEELKYKSVEEELPVHGEGNGGAPMQCFCGNIAPSWCGQKPGDN